MKKINKKQRCNSSAEQADDDSGFGSGRPVQPLLHVDQRGE